MEKLFDPHVFLLLAFRIKLFEVHINSSHFQLNGSLHIRKYKLLNDLFNAKGGFEEWDHPLKVIPAKLLFEKWSTRMVNLLPQFLSGKMCIQRLLKK